MPDSLTAAEMAALSSITDAAGRINAHLTALKALAASVTHVPSIPPVPIVSAAETSTNRVPLSPAPPIRASLIGEPMQQQPITPPTPKALDLARYQVPPGVKIEPDHGA